MGRKTLKGKHRGRNKRKSSKVRTRRSRRHKKQRGGGAVTVSTFAGTATVSGNIDGLTTSAKFNALSDINLDPTTGIMYISDTNNMKVRKVLTDGTVSTYAGTGVSGNTNGLVSVATFSTLGSTAMDSKKNMYVSDGLNKCIRKIDTAGNVTMFANGSVTPGITYKPLKGVEYPEIPYYDPAGGQGATLVVQDDNFTQPTDYHYNPQPVAGGFPAPPGGNGFKIYADNAGKTLLGIVKNYRMGGSAYGNVFKSIFLEMDRGVGFYNGMTIYYQLPALPPAPFSSVNGLAIDKSDNVYLAESTGGRIRKIDPTGVVTTFVGNGTTTSITPGSGTAAVIGQPSDLVFDPTGNLYASSNNAILKITPGGVVSVFAGNTGAPSATISWKDGTGTGAIFSSPARLACDPVGNIYVADKGNACIRKITPSGVVTTVAGVPKTPGYLDGDSAIAKFNNPTGIAISFSGDIYVADSSNHCIRKITGGGPSTTEMEPIMAPLRASQALQVASQAQVSQAQVSQALKIASQAQASQALQVASQAQVSQAQASQALKVASQAQASQALQVASQAKASQAQASQAEKVASQAQASQALQVASQAQASQALQVASQARASQAEKVASQAQASQALQVASQAQKVASQAERVAFQVRVSQAQASQAEASSAQREQFQASAAVAFQASGARMLALQTQSAPELIAGCAQESDVLGCIQSVNMIKAQQNPSQAV